MNVDVALLPSALRPNELSGKTVVVLDVLRATTTMAAALAAGVREIRIFDNIEEALAAAREAEPRPGEGEAPAEPSRLAPILCGERQCLRPPGFDLGNSPGAFSPAVHAGRTMFMATTNGTRAIVAARQARSLFIGALVNASATARAVRASGGDVLLLCAGTDGALSMEDLIGAGAIISHLAELTEVALGSDVARIARQLFLSCRDNLHATLADAQGGRNVIRAGLPEDVEYAARLDALDVAGIVNQGPLRVARA